MNEETKQLEQSLRGRKEVQADPDSLSVPMSDEAVEDSVLANDFTVRPLQIPVPHLS